MRVSGSQPAKLRGMTESLIRFVVQKALSSNSTPDTAFAGASSAIHQMFIAL